jgi:hypothetical protein
MPRICGNPIVRDVIAGHGLCYVLAVVSAFDIKNFVFGVGDIDLTATIVVSNCRE